MAKRSRHQSTIEQLANLRHVFDRFTKDGTGGRVNYFARMPRNYDNKAGLPWSDVKGRYWYPWRGSNNGA